MTYRIFGLVLDSDVPLRELEPCAAGGADLVARLRSPHLPRRSWTWVDAWSGQGRVWLKIGRHGDDWLLRFPRLADFLLTDGASTIVGRGPRVPANTLKHLLVDQVVPVALSGRGHTVLHASAIATAAGAAVFTGVSGVGKSTVAASFSASGDSARFFADDAVRVVAAAEGIAVASARSGARLWPDVVSVIGAGRPSRRIAHYSTKRRLHPPAENCMASLLPLRAVYVLSKGAGGQPIEIRRIPRRRALLELITHCYVLDSRDRTIARGQFETLAALSERVPVFSLAFPHDLAQIPALRNLIAAHLVACAA